jgi:putative ABC transport system permease protein
MPLLRRIFIGLLDLFRQRRNQHDLDEELHDFLEAAIENKMRSGMTHEQALRAARMEMGSTAAVRDRVHDSNWESLLVSAWQDVRFGARTLRKAPSFSLTAVLTIALGIGATTIMVALVDGILIRPLHYKNSAQLMYLTEAYQRRPGMSLSVPNFRDWEAQNEVFSSMAANQPQSFTLTGNGLPEQLEGRYVTNNWFRTLDLTPILGRDFLPQDDHASADPVVMLGYSLWQRRFGSDPNIVGRTITLNQRSFTVIGVAPRGAYYRTFQPDLYAPLGLEYDQPWTQQRGGHGGIYAIARLKPGITLERARQDMDVIAGRLQQQFPQTNRDNWISVRPLREVVVGDARIGLLVLSAGVALLLLIACGNVANLLLARASSRTTELRVRMALGASRIRLVRQMLTESVLLAAAGGLVGILLCKAGEKLLFRAISDSLPRAGEISVDGRVIAIAFLIVVLTGVLFGLAPAFYASATRSGSSLTEASRTSATWGTMRLRNSLIVGELALALGLLVGAGLLARSFARVLAVDPGFNPQNVLTADLIMQDKYADKEKAELFFAEVMHNIRALPGVVSAAAITPLPMSGNEWDTYFLLDGESLSSESKPRDTEIAYLSPDYLKTMQVPLLSGRTFLESDTETSAPVAIVNAAFARQYWPNQNPIGRHVRLLISEDTLPSSTKHSVWRTVVGLIGDVKQYGLDSKTVPTVYTPFAQQESGPVLRRDLVIRAASDPLSLAEEVRKAIAQADRDQAISAVQTMEQYISESLAARELYMAVLVGFAISALALAAIGTYGVISYWVAQRRREIGIRVALGAQSGQILKLVLKRITRLVISGVILGGAASLLMGRWMQSLLFGVSAADMKVFIVVMVLLAGVAVLACYIPARRAVKVDPNLVLRYE